MGSIGKRKISKGVDLSLAEQKVWLVKVPKFVAEAWEAGVSLSSADLTNALADPCLERITVVSSAHFSSHS